MTGVIELRRLDWDSGHFGLEIGQLSRPPGSAAEASAALREARVRGFDCVYCLVDAADLEPAWRLEAVGFVARDLRLEFRRVLEARDAAVADHSPGLRPCVDADLEPMAALSASAFPGTRFAADPRFARPAVAGLYEVWLRNSVAGFADAVLVDGEPGSPQGFVTLHAAGAVARIGLIAVDPRARASGRGRTLVQGAVDWAARRRCSELQVVTQGSNVAAQRLYQRCGFVTHAAHTWFHAWPGTPAVPNPPLPETRR